MSNLCTSVWNAPTYPSNPDTYDPVHWIIDAYSYNVYIFTINKPHTFAPQSWANMSVCLPTFVFPCIELQSLSTIVDMISTVTVWVILYHWIPWILPIFALMSKFDKIHSSLYSPRSLQCTRYRWCAREQYVSPNLHLLNIGNFCINSDLLSFCRCEVDVSFKLCLFVMQCQRKY